MFISLISLITACVTSIVALYLVKTRPDGEATTVSDISHLETRLKDESSDAWESWSNEQFIEFLSGFLLDDELAVVKGMAYFFREDSEKGSIDCDDYGWRNKHRIINATKVPQRIIYSRNGIIERLLSLGMAEAREASSGWGKQKHHYRLNPRNKFVVVFLASYRN